MSSGASDSVFENGRAFVEAHFYDGGLRNTVVANSANRPSWAPDFQWVGFRDETRLEGSDIAVEIVKFASSSTSIAWIGVYTHATDAKYGDRNNHAGVGVWLRDYFPHDPEILIDGLGKLLKKLKKGSLDDFTNASNKFVRGFLDRIISPYVQLAAPLDGLPPATGQTFSTVSYFVPKDDKVDSRLNDLFYRAFFLHPNADGASRMLIHVSEFDRTSGFVSHQSEGFDSDLVKLLPTAFGDQAREIERLAVQRTTLDKELYNLDIKVDALHGERDALLSKLDAASQEHEEFKKSIEDNDELKRFAAIHGGVSKLQQTTEEILRIIPELQRGIVKEVHSELNRIAKYNQQSPSFVGATTNRHPARDNTRPSDPDKVRDWPHIIFLAIFTLVIIFVVIGAGFLLNHLMD